MKASLLLTLALLAPSFASAAPCAKEEQITYVQTIDRFNVGVMTRTDIAQAQLAYIEASLACGDVEKTQYCFEAPQAVSTQIEGIKFEQSVGQRTTAELIAAQKDQARITAFCAQK